MRARNSSSCSAVSEISPKIAPGRRASNVGGLNVALSFGGPVIGAQETGMMGCGVWRAFFAAMALAGHGSEPANDTVASDLRAAILAQDQAPL